MSSVPSPMLLNSLNTAISRWESVQQLLQATQASGPSMVTQNSVWANSPLNTQGMLPNIQAWLDSARAARASMDPAAIQRAVNTARDAWRSVAATVQSAAPAAEPVIATAEPVVSGAEPLIAAAEPVIATGEELITTVQNNPTLVVGTLAAAGNTVRTVAVGGVRGMFGGWVGVAVGALVGLAVALGAYAWSNSGNSSSHSTSQVAAVPAPQSVGSAPVPPQQSGPETLLGGGTTSTSSAPAPALPAPTPSSLGQPEQQQQQQQSAPPPPPAQPATTTAAPQCGYPNAIGVTGGSVSTLGGQGGSFKVTGAPVVLSVSGLVNCSHHYQLGFTSSSGGYGYDCKMSSFQYDISRYAQSGDTVSVYLNLPPNACG